MTKQYIGSKLLIIGLFIQVINLFFSQTSFAASIQQGGIEKNIYRKNVNTSSILSTSNSALYAQSSKDTIYLSSGSILVKGNNSLSVITSRGKVHIRKNAIVLIEADKTGLRIQSICQNSRQSVNVETESHTIDIADGHEAVITASLPNPQLLFNNKRIGRRNIESEELANGLWLTSCEISAVDLVLHADLVKKLHVNSNHKSVSQKVVKYAAATTIALSGRQPFQYLNNNMQTASAIE